MKTILGITILLLILAIVVIFLTKRNMNKTIEYSFLIGSGFSFPFGMPLVKDINTKFTNAKPEDIYIGSDRYATFNMDGQEDPNGWMTIDQKNFFCEFIEDYCDFIGDKDKFQYEEFYDYYYSFKRGEENERISNFCDSYRIKYNKEDNDINLISRFNDAFTQLLSSLLQKAKLYENAVHYMDYQGYDSFIQFLNHLSEENIVMNVHTLNHDLLFEHICSNTSLYDRFCDGYSEKGSKYYGDLKVEKNIKKNYKVRIKFFQNSYEKLIRLLKLHGSIDTYSFNLTYPDLDRTRVKGDYGVFDFYKEIYDEQNGSFDYVKGHHSIYPDFLSGTTEKLRNYADEYYEIIFNHFKENLKSSEKLIIIGYGFGDSGINEIIKENYISTGKEPIVIDPYKSSSPFYQNNDFKHLEKGISQVTVEEFKNL